MSGSKLPRVSLGRLHWERQPQGSRRVLEVDVERTKRRGYSLKDVILIILGNKNLTSSCSGLTDYSEVTLILAEPEGLEEEW